jgi:hypothetical protein
MDGAAFDLNLDRAGAREIMSSKSRFGSFTSSSQSAPPEPRAERSSVGWAKAPSAPCPPIFAVTNYLILLHSVLHAADVAVHCATHDPDSPQFRAQEKLFELQSETHSANVCFCASRSLSIDVPALLAVIPDSSDSNITVYLMASSPQGNNGSGRCISDFCFGRDFRNGIWP